MKNGEERGNGKGFPSNEEVLAAELESLYQKVASLDSPQTSAEIREEAAPKVTEPYVREVSHPREGDNTQESTEQTSKVISASRRHYWILGVVLTIIAVAAVSVYFWSNLYYYETMSSGNKVYPLRINKLTASASFYDGKTWVAPPPAAAAGALSSEAAKKENEIQSRQAVKTAGKKKNSFSIQVASFKENDEALAWVESMDIEKYDVRIIKVNVQEKGIWHRIVLGRFDSSKEAYHYLEMHQLREQFPDCFIRSDNDLAGAARLGQN